MMKDKRGIVFVSVLFAIIFTVALANSLFIHKRDRVNILLHSKDRITYYSLSTTDEVNYIIYFRPDSKIIVPGGYKYYRFGAMAKLAQLEKDPQLLKKAFSSATSSFTDIYFYPSKPEILYGTDIPQQVIFPSFSELFFDNSNASFLDRVFLGIKFTTTAKAQFSLITSPVIEADFAKAYQGFFYSRSYRKERKLVQILYTKKYKTADLISRILEGNGIQVVDISQKSESHKKCLLIENTERFSKTTNEMAKFFRCDKKTGDTGTFDILFILGDTEDQWEA